MMNPTEIEIALFNLAERLAEKTNSPEFASVSLKVNVDGRLPEWTCYTPRSGLTAGATFDSALAGQVNTAALAASCRQQAEELLARAVVFEAAAAHGEVAP